MIKHAGFKLLFTFTMMTASMSSNSEPFHTRGIWVWKVADILSDPKSTSNLVAFCKEGGINEIYLSVPSNGSLLEDQRFRALLRNFKEAKIRTEALLSSIDADIKGAPRERLVSAARKIVTFNEGHPLEKFDGIHLDVEPQQRPENKRSKNLTFLPGLLDTYREVANLARPAGLTISADTQLKVLDGTKEQRLTLLRSLSRVTLMLYEVAGARKDIGLDKLKHVMGTASRTFLDKAYSGIEGSGLAATVIGIRTADFDLNQIAPVLSAIDKANAGNQFYAGCAQHAYGDYLKSRGPL